MKNSKELLEQRGVLDLELDGLAKQIDNKSITEDGEKRFDTLLAEIETLNTDIATAQKREAGIKAAEARKAPSILINPTKTDNEEQVKREFRLNSFILEASEKGLTGINKEMHDEGLKEMRSSNISPMGFVIPTFIVGEKRALTTGTGDTAKAGYTIQTDVLGSSWIDVLRNASVVVQAGGMYLSGLQGNVAIPKLTTSAGGSWLTETGAITAADNVHGQLSGTPKRYGNATAISKTLLVQSSIDAELMVRNDLVRSHAVAVDTAALIGTGSSNQPSGISVTAGIGSVAGGTNGLAPTWANVVALETAVAQVNAAMGKLAYITNAKVRGKMKTVLKDSGSGLFLWDKDNTVNGYPTFVTNSMPSNLTKGSASGICSSMYFGNFEDLAILQWGGLDLIVDGYSLAKSNQIEVVANGYYDVIVRRAESFAACLDLLTT